VAPAGLRVWSRAEHLGTEGPGGTCGKRPPPCREQYGHEARAPDDGAHACRDVVAEPEVGMQGGAEVAHGLRDDRPGEGRGQPDAIVAGRAYPVRRRPAGTLCEFLG